MNMADATLCIIHRQTASAVAIREIEVCLQSESFAVLARWEGQLSTAQAQTLHAEKLGTVEYDDLVAAATAGPIVALALARHDAVGRLQALVAADSGGGAMPYAHAVHCSASASSAARELKAFFPKVFLANTPSASSAPPPPPPRPPPRRRRRPAMSRREARWSHRRCKLW